MRVPVANANKWPWEAGVEFHHHHYRAEFFKHKRDGTYMVTVYSGQDYRSSVFSQNHVEEHGLEVMKQQAAECCVRALQRGQRGSH